MREGKTMDGGEQREGKRKRKGGSLKMRGVETVGENEREEREKT